MKLNVNETIKDVLYKTIKMDKPIDIHLKSNKSFTGNIQTIGQHCISFKQAGNRSFFDVIINISDIAAVEVQVRE